MKIKSGEVIVSPNTIYWVQIPLNISEDDKIELLKKDILLINCNYKIEDLPKLKEKLGDSAAFFINLDGLIQKGTSSSDTEYTNAVNIAKFLEGFAPAKTVVHTFTINDQICDVFRSRGLIYIEKNFGDTSSAVNTIYNLIKPIFTAENKIQRSFLRVGLYPEIKLKAEVSNLLIKNLNVVCYLKDISLSGLGLILMDKNDITGINLKDTIQIKIFTERSLLSIHAACVTRKDIEKLEVGVNFNINDKQMVKEDTANYIVKLIYKWLKEIIDQYGKID